MATTPVCAIMFDPLGEFDELGCTRSSGAARSAVARPTRRPRRGGRHQQSSRLVGVRWTIRRTSSLTRTDQKFVVAGPFEPMKAQAGARQVQLQVERASSWPPSAPSRSAGRGWR